MSAITPPRRAGFTLIEILIVLSIMVLLMGIGIGSIGAHLRRSSVQQAVAQVSAVASQARTLAMRSTEGDVAYGVEISDAPGEGALVRLLKVEQGGGVEVLAAEDGSPVNEVALGDGVVVWQADGDLRNADEPTVRWFYRSGTGTPVQVEGGAIGHAAVSVGTAPPSYSRVWGLDRNTGQAPVVAPAEDRHPGLSFRAPGNDYRIAFYVNRSGLVHHQEF